MMIKLSKTRLIWGIILLFMFRTGYFDRTNFASVILLLANLMTIASGIYVLYQMIKKRYHISRIAIGCIIYITIYILISILCCNFSIGIFMRMIKWIFTLLVIDYLFYKNRKHAIYILEYVFEIYVYLNLVTVILFPNGLYQIGRDYSQWTTLYSDFWLIGNKNNIIKYIIIALCISCIRAYLYDKSKRLDTRFWALLVVSITSCYLVNSTTSIVILSVIFFYILLYRVIKRIKMFNIVNYTILYTVLWISIISGKISIISGFVTDFLGKDMTFTGRTTAWAAALSAIARKPLIGYGFLSDAAHQSMLGSAAFVNTHNTILEVMVQGGLVQLILYIVVNYILIKNIIKIRNTKLRAYLSIIYILIDIECLFEVWTSCLSYWVILIVLGNSSLVDKE